MTSAYPRPNPARFPPIAPAGHRARAVPVRRPNGPFRPMSAVARPATQAPNPPLVRPALRKSAKVSFRCVYHIVWCTQYRAPVIDEVVAHRLRKIIADVVDEKEQDAWLAEVKFAANHVYLIVEASPQLGIHRLVKAMKSRSAHTLRAEFPSLRTRLPSLWTNSYLVNTVGSVAVSEMIRQFVEEQPTR